MIIEMALALALGHSRPEPPVHYTDQYITIAPHKLASWYTGCYPDHHRSYQLAYWLDGQYSPDPTLGNAGGDEWAWPHGVTFYEWNANPYTIVVEVEVVCS